MDDSWEKLVNLLSLTQDEFNKINAGIEKIERVRDTISEVQNVVTPGQDFDNQLWILANSLFDEYRDKFSSISMTVDDVHELLERKVQSDKDKESVKLIYAAMNKMSAQYRKWSIIIAVVTLILLIFFW